MKSMYGEAREEHQQQHQHRRTRNTASKCAVLKARYHDCFNRWYTDQYLKGEWRLQECALEWAAYSACVSKRIDDAKLGHLLQTDALLQQNDPGK
ncbi:hypothetical protein O6H91_12G015100 [Diphasiastrum complanatum]|uniref:Uncharacterized protein n=1 Tax=Diphasiastrum complanatum TaxID=34168 RepID=A0ACC2BZ81_DIPCM|nr:hypothetical protein O6H91_12G015100 [Diphasiastrum complanatum]